LTIGVHDAVSCATPKRIAIKRERRKRRLFWFWFVSAISKRRHGYVKITWKRRVPAETRIDTDQQNGDRPNSQQQIDVSKSREDVSGPAHGNSDRHVKGSFRTSGSVAAAQLPLRPAVILKTGQWLRW
jgi:hypothetical protein